MTPKQQAFQDMRESGLDIRVFDLEFILLGYKIDGRMTNGRKKNRKIRITLKKPVRTANPVKSFILKEIEGGFLVRL